MQTAAITGAAGGIGRALVTGFTAAGWRVLALDRVAPDNGSATVEARGLDVTDAAAVRAWGADLTRLDVLINAAGILRRDHEHDPDVFAEVVDVNLVGMMRMCSAAKPALAASGKGAVVNFASMWSLFGGPMVPGYTASKSGVVGLTRSLAVAWAKDGIRVNAIAPGWIETPMTVAARQDESRNRTIMDRTPMGRWGQPEDIVGPALFLAGDASGFVTGTVLPVDGGYAAM